MAARKPSLLLLFCLLMGAFMSSQGSQIAIYWGQDSSEGSLQDTCNTNNYGIVILAFLSSFGNGQTPGLNLAGHCNPNDNSCTSLTSEISACQQAGIKVLLSLGGGNGVYSLSSTGDAQQLADYLWNNFLGGQSDSRPLGSAVLDGIDFDIETGGESFYSDLATALKAHNDGQKTIYLSAAPQCPFPDAQLNSAIATGQFDYVWVQFYNNPPCQYVDSADNLLAAWNKWSSFQNYQLFLGLPASTAAAPSGGYISADILTSQILPSIKGSANYGGVMLWSRKYDTDYSTSIKGSI